MSNPLSVNMIPPNLVVLFQVAIPNDSLMLSRAEVGGARGDRPRSRDPSGALDRALPLHAALLPRTPSERSFTRRHFYSRVLLRRLSRLVQVSDLLLLCYLSFKLFKVYGFKENESFLVHDLIPHET